MKPRNYENVEREKLLARIGEIAKGEYHLSTMTAVDNEATLEVLYFFELAGEVKVLRVTIKAGADAWMPTITNVMPSAVLYEREIQEMFGIQVKGHPRPVNTIISDDYKGKPPFLKSTKFGENKPEMAKKE